MSDKEKGLCGHGIPKAVNYRQLCRFIKINEHVSAKNNIEVAQPRIVLEVVIVEFYF